MACHLKNDADPVPEQAYHFDADPDVDPDPDFYLMRIRIFFDTDADPGYKNDADQDPKHCLIRMLPSFAL